MARPSKVSVATVKRNQRFRGPGLSAQQNDMQDELIRDITEIQAQHNNFTVPLTSLLPDGTQDSGVDAFRNGLDGQTLFVNATAVNNAALARYYNLVQGRPNTAYEQFQEVYSYVDASLVTLEQTITAGESNSELTASARERIGLNVFDGTLASGATSIDAKTNKNEINIVQLARDMYGSAYVSFSIDGTGVLTNSVRAMVDALLEAHSGDWDTDVSLIHALDASEITSGTFLQSRVGPSSTAPAGVNDSYVGTPGDAVDDLNQIRTLLKDLKGTIAFTTAIVPDGSWAPVTTQPTHIQNLISLIGTGTRSDTNPWGLDYSDIDQLSNIVTAENAYTGRTSALDNSTVYSHVAGFSNGDSLVSAVGTLASGLNITTAESAATTSGLNVHVNDTANPHEVTLTQAAAEGGSAPASQVDITDAGGIYTSATVEDALQEIWTLTTDLVTTTSGELQTQIDTIVTVSGTLQTQIDAVQTQSDLSDIEIDLLKIEHEGIFIPTPANQVYTLLLDVPYDGVVQKVTSQGTAGSALYSVLIDDVVVNGGNHSIDTTKSGIVFSNAFSTGSEIDISVSGVSSLANASFSVHLKRD